jgi:Recombinase
MVAGTTKHRNDPRKTKGVADGLLAEVVAKAVQLRQQGKTHLEVCEELNRLGYRTRTGKPWRHPQQIVKLLQSSSRDD